MLFNKHFCNNLFESAFRFSAGFAGNVFRGEIVVACLAYRFVPRARFVWQRLDSPPATQPLSKNLHYPGFSSLNFWLTLISSPNTQRIRESGVAEQVGARCQTFAIARGDSPVQSVENLV